LSAYTVLHTEWSLSWGGQEIRILTECRELLADGHRPLLAGRPGAPILAAAAGEGVETRELALAGPWDLASARRLRRLIREERVDILHTHASVDSWVGLWAGLAGPAAWVRTRHTGSVRVHPLNLIYTRPRRIITTGGAIRRALVEGYGLDPNRVVSIPTGIDVERFSPGPREPELCRELGIEPDAPVVAMVAVLRSWKRHDLFCEMAAVVGRRLPRARFLIVGGGPGWERVNGYLEAMGLRDRVVMTGHRQDVERLLRLADVTVLTSGGEEGVSQSVLQALACEKGVVAADEGSITDAVEHERTGLLVPFGRVEALAAAVERLLGDQELRRRLGRAGRRLVAARFTARAMHHRIMQVYRQAAPRGG
jgi:glycosyltransferase involved in cell wall biosynthesis